MWLDDQSFKTVIAYTPLISIDLIVRNENGEILLGRRLNAPAKGFWFVPGGRVRKNETLDAAFIRLLHEELGVESGIARADAKFLGVFEHFYDDAVFGDDVSTHYVVLAYEFLLKDQTLVLPFLQHDQYVWWEKTHLLLSDTVHQNTKNYFLIDHLIGGNL